MCCGYIFWQFPAVNHPQTLERRYLGIIGGALLDLLKVGITSLAEPLRLARLVSIFFPGFALFLLACQKDIPQQQKVQFPQNPAFGNCIISTVLTS